MAVCTLQMKICPPFTPGIRRICIWIKKQSDPRIPLKKFCELLSSEKLYNLRQMS